MAVTSHSAPYRLQYVSPHGGPSAPLRPISVKLFTSPHLKPLFLWRFPYCLVRLHACPWEYSPIVSAAGRSSSSSWRRWLCRYGSRPQQTTYSSLLADRFFSRVGRIFVCRRRRLRFPLDSRRPARQRARRLWMGNIGQSAAVFLGPLLAARVGMPSVYHGARGASRSLGRHLRTVGAQCPACSGAQSKGLGDTVRRAHPREALLAAVGILLPYIRRLCRVLHLSAHAAERSVSPEPADAGFRTAGFVVLATLLRPVGGWLSDRIGGARVLSVVFLVIAICAAAGLAVHASVHDWCAGLRGADGPGNGAVFKLVPQYFPATDRHGNRAGRRDGRTRRILPAAPAGLFPDTLGVIWPGFVLLAADFAALWWANPRVFIPRQHALDLALRSASPPRGRPVARWRLGHAVDGLLVAAIVVGSRNLENFDPALVIYTFAVIFATWGVVYHYNVWLDKPPTRIYWHRGWELFRSRGISAALSASASVGDDHIWSRRDSSRSDRASAGGCTNVYFGDAFWPSRSRFRWSSAGSISDRCRTIRRIYVTYMFGFPAGTFPAAYSRGLAAVSRPGYLRCIWCWRGSRSRCGGASRQGRAHAAKFGDGFLPVILLFAISVTGLALTVSQEWLRGSAYSFLAILHAITVIAALLFLPFGKFFHIFQRPGATGSEAVPGDRRGDPGALCARCGSVTLRNACRDLRAVLPQLGFDYAVPGPPATGRIYARPANEKHFPRAQTENHGGTHWLSFQSRNSLQSSSDRISITCRRGAGGENREPADKLVKTHCCFCGQQCGIQLKVRDNRVIGFEPWEDFPFNQGMLCPKGVKRYLQGTIRTGCSIR